MGMHFDSGLDRHEWETRWQELEPLLDDTPAEALPEAVDLITGMMREMEYAVDDATADAPTEEPLSDLRELRRVAGVLANAGDVAPDELADGVDRARRLYGYLIDNRRDWGPIEGEPPG